LVAALEDAIDDAVGRRFSRFYGDSFMDSGE
jgi:hypothetical protein